MKFTTAVLALCLSITVSAHKNHTGAGGMGGGKPHLPALPALPGLPGLPKLPNLPGLGNKHNKRGKEHHKADKCEELQHLTMIANLANNATEQAKRNLTSTDVQKLKAEATKDAPKLAKLNSNSTFVSHCQAIDAHKELVGQCHEMNKLTHLANFANNATEQSKHNLTAAEVQKLKTEAAKEAPRLAKLNGNSTLVADCAIVDAGDKLKGECHKIQELTHLAMLNSNATALQAEETKRHLSADQMQKLKMKAAAAPAELQKLQGNSTLTAACTTIKDTRNHEAQEDSTTATTAMKSTSAAPGLLSGGAFAAAMCLLATLLAL